MCGKRNTGGTSAGSHDRSFVSNVAKDHWPEANNNNAAVGLSLSQP